MTWKFDPKEYLFQDTTKLRAFTDIGCYPMFYASKNQVLCPECATVTLTDPELPQITGVDVNWEDPALFCDECGERIESAYAEDEA